MQLTHILGASAALLTTAHAQELLSTDAVLFQPYAVVSSDAFLIRRQEEQDEDEDDSTPIGLNADGSFNASTWTAETHAACQSTLSSLRRSPNPAGSSVCFNLPSLDTETGVFEADLRLYRVFPPSGRWEGVASEDIDVSVGFPSAQVDEIAEEDLRGMGLAGNVRGMEKRQQADDMPELMQAYLLVGRIKEDQMKPNMSMGDLEALLMPVLTLRAAGGELETTVSPNSASFITGVFSNTTPQSSFSLAQRAVDVEVARLASGEVPFVLPGMTILIFPIGAIITGVWLLIGLAAYGYGTYQRYQFRETYRQRKAAMDNMGRAGRGGPGF